MLKQLEAHRAHVELDRPDRPLFAGEDAFRFRHLLMRDAAYDGLPKAERAELHEQFADWLAEHAGELVELDELLGYHLEAACRYRQELGPPDEHGRALAARAGERLKDAGRRAVDLNDFRAGIGLLERAAALLSGEQLDPAFEYSLAWGRFMVGRADDAVAGLRDAAARAGMAGALLDERQISIELASYETVLAPSAGAGQRLRALAEAALPDFEAAGDPTPLMIGWVALLIAQELDGRSQAARVEAAERVLDLARQAGNPTYENWADGQLNLGHYLGSTPVEECLRRFDGLLEPRRAGFLGFGLTRGPLSAMLGRFEEAHLILAEAGERIAELGAVRSQVSHALWCAEVARIEGDATRTEAAAREACEKAEVIGELGNFMWLSALAAQALLDLDRDTAAEEWLDRGLETAPSEERQPQILARDVRGRLLARRGELGEGERLVREAVALAAETDMLNAHADALIDLAEVLTLAGQDAQEEFEQALALYERKGNLVMAERTRSRLAESTAPR